jgi:biotin-dependent carboxylase-like uncharacterized protein
VSALLRIEAAGPGVTVQDAGRRGFLRYGVTPAGPMDADAFAAATMAAVADAAIEVSLGGVSLAAEEGAIGLAIAGGGFDVRLDDRLLPSGCVFTLAPGARLVLRPGVAGAFAYVAPFGRFDLPPVLGSLAIHARSGLGGFAGRGLCAGDALRIAEPRPEPAETLRLCAPWTSAAPARLRVLLGPQDDFFARETIELFLDATWRLSPRSDRMAYRLEGPRLISARCHDIVSDGLAFGAIQVPGEGAPLVLMADRQPTGGYPKIAHVIGADLPALAQKRPGEELRFAAVKWEEAVAARRARAELLAAGVQLEPLAQELTSEFLLSRNLIDGATQGDDA